MTQRPERFVVAFGGNAITGPDDTGEIHEQFYHSRVAVRGIGTLLASGAGIAITHGNGPQVGTALERMEMARKSVPPRPLGVLVADTQGGIGYMIAQVVRNWISQEGLTRQVSALVTQVVVAEDDPAMAAPTKPIGQPCDLAPAEELEAQGWTMTGDERRGYRRLVPSPIPVRIVEARAIRTLMDDGQIVIACGGGGIPVIETGHGDLDGVDAVVDKDLASALLASEIDADRLVVLTGVNRVMLGYGSPNPKPLESLTLTEARRYLAEGEFPPGSMGPKMQGVIDFLSRGGKEALITSFSALPRAWKGEDGTRIVPD